MIFIACVNLESVEYETKLTAGEAATFKMNIAIDAAADVSDTRLVIGFLVPKSWDAADNTYVTYTSDFDEGVKHMSLVPEDDLPKNADGLTWRAALNNRYGVGPNVLEDMEWLVYWSDKSYNISNGEKPQAQVTIKSIPGTSNMNVKLGFFLNHTDDGMSTDQAHNKIEYTECIEIEGEGSLIDFCELHINSAQPTYATQEDVVTIKYNGNIFANALDEAREIYLCATVYTENGNTYEVCEISDKTKMIKESEFGRTFNKTFWPGGYFDVPDGEIIERIEYTFKNEDGSIELMEIRGDGTETPFEYMFSCK